MITQARLHEIFDYDAHTGNLVWKVATARRIKVGDVAGCTKEQGYRTIRLDGRSHLAHRLVWMWHHGEWPKHEIDHIDRDPANNRIENLRDVSSSINQLNRRYRSNKTGLAGVAENGNQFMAQLNIFGKPVYLGTFDTPEEAHHVFKRVHFDLHGKHSKYAPEFVEA